MSPSQSSLNPTRHLTDGQLAPVIANCPICNAPVQTGQTRKQIVLQENPRVTLVECSNCRAVSASRMPTDAYLRTYYASYYDEFHDAPRVAFRDIRRFANHVVSGAMPFRTLNTIRLLDYGGGDGRIALDVGNILREHTGAQTAEVDCFDLSGTAPALSPHSRITIRACSRPNDLVGRRYHVIIASAVFEHIPHPRPVMKALLSALEHGGWLYARTPYIAPVLMLANMLGIRFPFGFPAHLHDLGPAFWNQCLTILGMDTTHALICSRPSIIETSLKDYPVRTILAWCLKQPWRLLRYRWPLVGGWEVWIRGNV